MTTLCDLVWPTIKDAFAPEATVYMDGQYRLLVSTPTDPRFPDTGQFHIGRITFEENVAAAIWAAHSRGDIQFINRIAANTAARINSRFDTWKTKYSGIHLTVYDVQRQG